MSNKTQLATNNTQLASLIQTLQGKAAGGGSSGGDGSGERYARGTFKKDSDWYPGTNTEVITASGLPFTPTKLIVRICKATSSFDTTASPQKSYYYPISAEYNGTSWVALAVKEGSIVTRNTLFSVVFNEDGFTLSTGTGTNFSMKSSHTYEYVAFE